MIFSKRDETVVLHFSEFFRKSRPFEVEVVGELLAVMSDSWLFRGCRFSEHGYHQLFYSVHDKGEADAGPESLRVYGRNDDGRGGGWRAGYAFRRVEKGDPVGE